MLNNASSLIDEMCGWTCGQTD